jgi:hypothetical protein
VLALSYTDIETGAVVTQQEGSSLLKKSTGNLFLRVSLKKDNFRKLNKVLVKIFP